VMGDRALECFYNGKIVTLVSPNEKVFGIFPALPTLDETVDAMTGRYDIVFPAADLITADPQSILMSEKTSGGWEKHEKINGTDCAVLAYTGPNVGWTIWIPTSGDLLPKKLVINYKALRGQPRSEIYFKKWDLSPNLADSTFVVKILDGYEGIPVIQRASAVIPELEEQDKRKSESTASPKLNTTADK